MNELSAVMSLLHETPLESIHPRYKQSTLILLHTIFPLFKNQYSSLMNIGSLSLFSFTSDTNDDSTPFGTTNPPYVKFMSPNPKCATLCTSFDSSFFSSARGATTHRQLD